MCGSSCKCIGCKNFEESPERKTLMHLADAAEVRVLQQTAAKTKLSSQISDLPSRQTHSAVTGERLVDECRDFSRFISKVDLLLLNMPLYLGHNALKLLTLITDKIGRAVKQSTYKCSFKSGFSQGCFLISTYTVCWSVNFRNKELIAINLLKSTKFIRIEHF